MAYIKTLTRRAAMAASALACACAALAVPQGAAMAAYPERPITLLVGFPPGGGGDLYGRLIALAMSKTLGQTVVVENRPGAGGNIAAEQVARANPDGYTLILAMSGNFAASPAFKPQQLRYKVPGDFAMIGLILEAPHGMFVSQNSPYKSAADVLKTARQKELTFASTGTGGAAHIGMERIKSLAGLNLLHVPYKGSGPAISDLIGGQVDLFFATASPLIGQVRQGQLRVLALTGQERSPALPEVPTFKELGVDMTMTQWYGLAAPAGTPKEVVETLSRHLSMALKDPAVRESIRKDAAVERDVPMDKFRQYVITDIEQYREAVTPELMKMMGL
ncbi:tripartite tricarboxylate transporter substrate binding protein [Pigmentiphaga sp.]|uniref:Bug family tripartite tricarboxylate transporter substrate binding protein n=1 Tax=Pigmentiphaga sp. TaxID=1977564 RepID=UPI00128B8162|nr:tripartite tricarboxylate transporter substrate binding protein [Pigmentiphaga sp.]MPS25230.1 tripartite tricarboxylate transporter substrate binding protein [Alcaligenaceae bacterium SAGV5]MPS54167.1 tripartite tricarboxylate transporter substrate binding protein [Alcaligenaceae bacterium SAGV3]MPT56196.1 tripartite tricarboxylate transporter substrate binding protein [Alcaligenaceae bacterium]